MTPYSSPGEPSNADTERCMGSVDFTAALPKAATVSALLALGWQEDRAYHLHIGLKGGVDQSSNSTLKGVLQQ